MARSPLSSLLRLAASAAALSVACLGFWAILGWAMASAPAAAVAPPVEQALRCDGVARIAFAGDREVRFRCQGKLRVVVE